MSERTDQNLSILTKRQRQVYLLRQQKLTFAQIGEQLGISAASAGTAYHAAHRRLRDATILHDAPSEHDTRPVDFPLTRGELEAIAGALFLLQREMCRKAGLSAPPHDPLPPRIDRVSALLYRAQRTLEQSKPTPPPHKPTE